MYFDLGASVAPGARWLVRALLLGAAALAFAGCSEGSGPAHVDLDALPGADQDGSTSEIAKDDSSTTGGDVAADASEVFVADTGAPADVAADLLAIDVAATDVPATDIAATDIQAIEVAATDIPPSCQKDSDCDIAAPCVVATCDGGQCAYAPSTAACDDGNACTTGDSCAAGLCVGSAVVDCDDNNACTKDSCNLSTGCTNTASEGLCSDGDACTADDSCVVGLCIGATVACDDGNACTADLCDKQLGCTHGAVSGECSDGNACTTGDACQAGTCIPTTNLVCDDAKACTIDTCSFESGCVFKALNGTPCDDGLTCSVADVCAAGACQGVVASCDDDNPCTDDSCVEAIGCVHLANAVTCSDGNACTEGDACQGGTCMFGSAPDCDDQNVCTKDSCDPAKGCHHSNADGLPCDDGKACSAQDACAAGACVGGGVNCDDGNVCTADDCDDASGCTHLPNAATCTDGNACTVEDACANGQCNPGVGLDCDDAKACTSDACDVMSGCGHKNLSGVCNDGDACTAGDVCSSGECTGTAVVCDDKNDCTTDSCDSPVGCVFKDLSDTTACDDGSVCTTADACLAGACVGTAIVCDDFNVCTNDLCDAKGGCTYPAANNNAVCSDGSVCTLNDTCQNGTCTGNGTLDCADSNPCTDESCDAISGCQQSNNTLPCDDNDLCTLASNCAEGVCVGESPVVCEASDQCHDAGICDGTTGLCSDPVTADGVTCSDGNGCTLTDTCASGICVGADPKVCTALDDCHLAGECDAESGACSAPVVTDMTMCNDGNECTQTDLCQAGVCEGSNPVICNPIDICHLAGTCDSTSGICSTPNADDGTACSIVDASVCKQGTCTGPTFTVAGPGLEAVSNYMTAAGSVAAPTSGGAIMDRSGTPSSPDDACNPFAPGAHTGRILLVRRGSCSFYTKASNAQAAGAVAMVLYNNVPGTPTIALIGAPAITIPVVSISNAEGVAIDAAIATGLTVLMWNAP